jgi:hypothetical protein
MHGEHEVAAEEEAININHAQEGISHWSDIRRRLCRPVQQLINKAAPPYKALGEPEMEWHDIDYRYLFDYCQMSTIQE